MQGRLSGIVGAKRGRESLFGSPSPVSLQTELVPCPAAPWGIGLRGRRRPARPVRGQLYHGELETMIVTLMEDIHQLSLTGADNDRKMRLVPVEYRVRLVLERFRKQNVN